MDSKCIQPLTEATVGNQTIQFHTSEFRHAFRADCGFQAFGWVLSIVMDDATDVPFSEDQAAQSKASFYGDLLHNGTASRMVLTPLPLRGMQTKLDPLQQLVVDHGVFASRAK